MIQFTTNTDHIPVLKWALFLLQCLGCCRKRTNIVSVFTAVSLLFMVFLLVLDISLHWDGITSLKRIIYMPACFTTMVKGMITIIQGKQYLDVLNDIKQFWTPNGFDPATQKNYDQIFKITTILCPFYVSFCTSFGVLLSALPWMDFTQRNFVLGVYSFCDKYASFNCWFSMWIWQAFLLVVQEIPLSCLFDTIFIICTAYIYNGIELLKVAFKQLDTDDYSKRHSALKETVQQHHVVMSFVRKVDNMFTGYMLVQFSCSLWSLILYLYMIVIDGMPPKIADVILYGTMYCIFTFQIFIYCFGGAIIQDQLKSLPTAIFEINWHGKGRTALRKELAFMIFRSQNARILSVGKMSGLNLVLFVSVIKNSLSIFTLILKVLE